MENLEEFLIIAKLNTYANGKSARVESSRQGSKDYHFEKFYDDKKYIYHDTYFGGKKFIGEEIVYFDSKPSFAMNYYGSVLDEDESEIIFNNVLRNALMKVGEDKSVLPLRGPSEFVVENYVYNFKSIGTLENFIGEETITKNGELVYKLCCHGGVIEK